MTRRRKKTNQKKVGKNLEDRFNFGLRRINDRLKHAREKAGLTIEAVAKKRRVQPQTVVRWETRAGAPKNQKLLVELALLYDTSYPWLSFRFGNESYSFEQGIELEYLKSVFLAMNREKQIATFMYIQKLMH